MKSRVLITVAWVVLLALPSFVANSVAQDYVVTVFSFGASTVSSSNPQPKFLAAFDGAAAGTTDFRIMIPRTGILKNLYWRAVTSNLTGSGNIITVLKNSTATSLTETWNTNELFGSNTTNADSVYAGDFISVRVNLSPPTARNINRLTVSFELQTQPPIGNLWTTLGNDIYYNTGNVGIGTATAGEELTVVGTVLADTFKFPDDSFLTSAPSGGGGGGGSSLDAADGSPANAVVVDNDGKVGIGTATPQEKLTKGPGSNSATEMFAPTGVKANVVSGGFLSSNKTYYFRIVATDGVGTTVSSTEVSRTIPSSPTSNRRIALSWDLVQGATSYRIYKGETSGGQDQYHVSPTNSFNYDSDAGTDAGTVPTVTDAYVNKLAAAGSSWVTGGNFGVGTTIPQEELTLASGSNSVTEMAIPTEVDASLMSGGNLPVGTHYFRIVASDGVKTTAGSAEVSEVVGGSTNNRIQLSWSPVLGAVKYRVYGGTTPGGESVYYETPNTTFPYDSHSNPGFNPGTVPPATTAYINKLSAAGNSWILGGNVGIGMTAPQEKLVVNGAFRVGDESSFTAFYIFPSTGVTRFMCNYALPWVGGVPQPGAAQGQYVFETRDGATTVERMRIDSNGNVGIGTTTPEAKLHVQSNGFHMIRLKQTQPGGSSWDFALGDNGLGIPGVFSLGYIGAVGGGIGGGPHYSVLALTPNGNVGIGTASPQYKLEVAGNMCANSYDCSSSRKLKTNIQPIEGALPKVQRLRGVSFDWKADSKHNIGLIAEEVGEVIPEVVTYEENGKDAKSVDYARLVAVLIEAVKEQQKQIEEHEKEIAELKAAVESLIAEKAGTEGGSVGGQR